MAAKPSPALLKELQQEPLTCSTWVPDCDTAPALLYPCGQVDNTVEHQVALMEFHNFVIPATRPCSSTTTSRAPKTVPVSSGSNFLPDFKLHTQLRDGFCQEGSPYC